MEKGGIRILGHVSTRFPQELRVVQGEILDEPIPRAHQMAGDDRLSDHEGAVFTEDAGGIGRIAPLDDQQVLCWVLATRDQLADSLPNLLPVVQEIAQVADVLAFAAQENRKAQWLRRSGPQRGWDPNHVEVIDSLRMQRAQKLVTAERPQRIVEKRDFRP